MSDECNDQAVSAAQFDIVFRGLREGFDANAVKAKFAELFKLDAAKVERIFNARKVTLKTNIDKNLADKYVVRLAAIGLLVDQIPVFPVGRALTSAQAPAQTAAPTVITPPVMSKAIYYPDFGAESPESAAMHQPVEFVYGCHTTRIPFQFDGNGREYLKLWLVNLLITVLSAGLLHPWAQVRSWRYFYQHTTLAGQEFNYTSHPQKIFLVQFLFLAFWGLSLYNFFNAPLYFLLGLVALVAILPWYWFKRAEFQLNHSFYMDVALQQVSTRRAAYVHYLGWPLLLLMSGGLLAPYAIFKLQQYSIQAKSLGGVHFCFSAKLKDYLQLLPPLIIAELATAGIIHWSQHLPFWLIVGVLLVIWLQVFLRWRVALVNLQWRAVSSSLGYFASNWTLQSYTKLVLKNMVYCALTLGFYWPWAKVRSAQYQAQHLAFFANQRFSKWQKSLLGTESD